MEVFDIRNMKILKRFLLKIAPSKLKNILGHELISNYRKELKGAKISYAQEGEDLILARFFGTKRNGFYVDVGSHHPERFSNTHIFYKKGWKGINIDAMPGSMSIFKQERPRDINIEVGVSLEKSRLTYFMFNEPALNTFSEEEAKKKDGLRNYKIIDKIQIPTLPLHLILQKHLPVEVKIDFMTVDVEGLDLLVLKSNNWKLYRPKLLLVEDLKKYAIDNLVTHSEVYKFMVAQKYQLIAKTYNTLFFKDSLSS